MSSTFSPLLGIELIGIGDQNNTWGTTTNTNLGTLLEQAIAGTTTIDVTSGDVTLTIFNGASNQARCAAIKVIGTPGVARNIIAPAKSHIYVVANGSNAVVTIKTAASTGVAVPAGNIFLVYFDPTVGIVDFKLVGQASATTNTANTLVLRDASGNFAAGTITAALTGNVTGNLNGNLTAASPTAATQTAGDNSTKVATTQYVATAVAPKAESSVTITAGAGLTGGGDLTVNRTLAIATTGVTGGTYGSSVNIPVLTLNDKGQVTNATVVTTTPFVFNVQNVGTLVANGTTGSYTLPANCIMVMGSNLHSMGSNLGSRVSVQIKNSAGTVLFDYPLTGGNETNGGDGGSGMFVRSAWSVGIPAAAAGGSLTFYRSSGSNNSWNVQVNQYVASA
jgi:hypothetical protein